MCLGIPSSNTLWSCDAAPGIVWLWLIEFVADVAYVAGVAYVALVAKATAAAYTMHSAERKYFVNSEPWRVIG